LSRDVSCEFPQIEEVWKREAQLEQETKKIQELQKQMNEERKQEEMLGVASSAGHIE
jgi:cell division protein FtsL